MGLSGLLLTFSGIRKNMQEVNLWSISALNAVHWMPNFFLNQINRMYDYLLIKRFKKYDRIISKLFQNFTEMAWKFIYSFGLTVWWCCILRSAFEGFYHFFSLCLFPFPFQLNGLFLRIECIRIEKIIKRVFSSVF